VKNSTLSYAAVLTVVDTRLPSVLVRQDMAGKYGITSIKTFENYTEDLKKIKETL
jgi:hypothetical protein